MKTLAFACSFVKPSLRSVLTLSLRFVKCFRATFVALFQFFIFFNGIDIKFSLSIKREEKRRKIIIFNRQDKNENSPSPKGEVRTPPKGKRRKRHLPKAEWVSLDLRKNECHLFSAPAQGVWPKATYRRRER